MEQMISVERAKWLIDEHVSAMTPKLISLKHASGLRLAEDVFSSHDIPAYPQSSMDGYAFAFQDGINNYILDGEMAAGSTRSFTLQQGCAVRIFTGAAVPPGADTVVMQEKTALQDGKLVFGDAKLKKGDNVRTEGSEIEKNTLALPSGTILTPALVGFLAGMGIAEVLAYTRPTIGIIITGNELQQPGLELAYGQVFDSNSFALQAALNQLQIDNISIAYAPDNKAVLQETLKRMLQDTDMILVTGGVSVGDYDFTMDAFEHCGVQKIFHKVKQKPGKPLLFGIHGTKPVFGLPGNPASVLSCFYQYVFPAIGKLMNKPCLLEAKKATLKAGFQKPVGLTQFLKAYFDGVEVELLTGQESYKLSSFSKANCLALIPENVGSLMQGAEITIHLLPQTI